MFLTCKTLFQGEVSLFSSEAVFLISDGRVLMRKGLRILLSHLGDVSRSVGDGQVSRTRDLQEIRGKNVREDRRGCKTC